MKEVVTKAYKYASLKEDVATTTTKVQTKNERKDREVKKTIINKIT